MREITSDELRDPDVVRAVALKDIVYVWVTEPETAFTGPASCFTCGHTFNDSEPRLRAMAVSDKYSVPGDIVDQCSPCALPEGKTS